MKVSTDVEDLRRAVRLAAKVVPARPAVESDKMLTITPCVEIIKISARAGGKSVSIEIPGIADGDAVKVDARMISDIASKLSGGEVKLETVNSHLVITNGASRSRLTFLEASESQETQGEPIIELTAGELLEGIRGTLYAVCEDSQRIALTGILFKPTSEGIEVCALDGFRLSIVKIHPDSMSLTRDLLVPAEGARLIVDALKDYQHDEPVRVYLKNSEMQIDCGDVLVNVTLLSAQYIDYGRIVNRDPGAVQVKVNVSEMRDAVSRATVAVGKTGLLRMDVYEDSMYILANDGELVDIKEGVFCDSTGEICIAFNAKYVSDMLANAHEKEITIDMVSPLSIALIHDGDRLAGILPVRVAE